MAIIFPRNLFMELFLDGAWQDVITLVRQTDNIRITRGRGSEQGAVGPGSLTCALDNTNGDFTPANPMGAYYGKLKQGTPLRFGLTVTEDSFTRTLSSGWGSTPDGEVWTTLFGVGIPGLATDWSVNGSAAVHSVPVGNGYRYSTLDTVIYRDIEVAATVTVPIQNLAGGAIEPGNVIVRHTGSEYYMARVSIEHVSEIVSISIHHSVDGELVAPVTVPGLADAVSNKVVRVKMQAEGQTLRAKVYAPGAEPVGWHVEVKDTRIPAAGAVGIRNGVAAGNSNTKPIVFQVDNFEVRALRFAGEVAEIKPQWNTTHTDKWVDLTAGTVLRRLQQGKTPLKSSLRRGYLADAIDFPVQYWPCEEGKDAQQFQSSIDDRHMSISGQPQFATFREFLSSEPLSTVNGSTWTGMVAPYAITGEAQVRFLVAVPKDGHGGGFDKPIARVKQAHPAMALQTWELVYKSSVSGGGLQLIIYNQAGAAVYTGGTIALALDGRLLRLSLEMAQNGGNVDWNLSSYDFSTGTAGGTSGSIAGTVSYPEQVVIGPTGEITDMAIGHITVQSELTSTGELPQEYFAWRGETPISRANRLAVENGIGWASIGSSSPHPMGPQLTKTLYDLFQECQDTIQGTLYDSRSTGNTLVLRTLNATYAQDARLTLNYAGGQVTPPLRPATDDRPIRNDVTAKRLEGGEYRVSRETGPLNAQDPGTDDDAAGRYDQQVTVNVRTELQLPNVAGWALHLGTTEAERFPKVTVDLAAPDVASLVDDLLDLELDDRFLITGLSDADFYDDIDLLVRGYTETFRDQYGHELEFNCAPYEPYNVAVWDTELQSTSRWDTAGSSLTSGISSSATSFSVTVSSGQLWTTAAGNFPLDIWIGGEKIRLSGISGATFTVASGGRALNGVTKAHAAGSPVRLFPPTYYAR